MGKANQFFDLNQEVSLSAGHDRMVVFARRRGGGLVHISQVDNGKACDCTCLACDEALIARHGEIREHSFAHQSGTQCRDAQDAVMHAVAADLIQRQQRFVTPSLHVTASVDGPHGPISDTRVQAAVQVPVEAVELVRHAPWKHPCVVATVKGHSLLIHLAFRKRAGASKLARLAELDLAAVEIDLTGTPPRTTEELARILFGADQRKSWLHNPKAAGIAADIRSDLHPMAEQRWQEYRQAIETRKQRQAQRAALAELERQRAAHLVAMSAVHPGLADTERNDPENSRPCGAVTSRFPKPAELSPSIEYEGPNGRVWLLHSSDPDIHFKVEAGVQHELEVLRRHGAVQAATAEVFRISREGWSAASIELAGTWRSARSVNPERQRD